MWLTNLRIVLPDETIETGSIRIEGEQIVDIIDGPQPNTDETLLVNCGGLTAIPGIIDVHGDMLEKEIEPRPGARFPIEMALHELDKRLAASGVTTAHATVSFNEAYVRPSLRTAQWGQDIIGTVTRLRDELLVDFRVHARFDITLPDAAPMLADLLSKGQVHLVSLNDHTPGQGQFRDLERHIANIAKNRNISLEEARTVTSARIEKAQSAPISWETVSNIIKLAKGEGLQVASHDDDTVDRVNLVADLGATISEFPITLEAAQEAKRRGMYVVAGSPNALRGTSLSGNLSAMEAIEAGLVDILASDYYPAALLYAVYTLARKQVLPLHEAVKLVSQNPATVLALVDRGSIEVGKNADVVLVEESLCPRVRGTLRNGLPVYWDDSMTGRTYTKGILSWPGGKLAEETLTPAS